MTGSAELTQSPQSVIRALVALYKKTNSSVSCSRIVELFESHPSLIHRVQAIAEVSGLPSDKLPEFLSRIEPAVGVTPLASPVASGLRRFLRNDPCLLPKTDPPRAQVPRGHGAYSHFEGETWGTVGGDTSHNVSSLRRRFPLPQNTEGFSRGLPRKRIVRPRGARRCRRRARHEHSRARHSLGRRLVGKRHPSRSR